MTTVKIDLPEEQAAVLEAKATAQGLSLEDFFRKLAEQEAPCKPRYTVFELIQQCDPDAPLSDEDRAWLDAPPVGREAL